MANREQLESPRIWLLGPADAGTLPDGAEIREFSTFAALRTSLIDEEPPDAVVHAEGSLQRDDVDLLRDRGIIVVLMVDHAGPTALRRVVETGADTFVEPSDGAALDRILSRELRRATEERRDLPTPAPPIVGQSKAIVSVCSSFASVAPSGAPVLVTGESGTGKELAARAIHRLSPRRSGPLVSVNCGAIPPTLIESELFGHEKGAFTGAESRREGRFELARGGTLFLDEIGELELMMQVRLLRVLQERTFTRVGGSELIDADVRIVAATNRDLSAQVADGSFREDLYYRLNVLHVELPPLRGRPGDVSLLWEHFVRRAAADEGRLAPSTAPEVFEALERHRWPGNVRELENLARRVVAMAPSAEITLADLPQKLFANGRDDEIRLPGMSLEEIERIAILKTYEATGSARVAAEILGISERKLFYRLKQYREEEESEANDRRPVLALVDDDDDFRETLGELLGRSFRVVQYESVTELMSALVSTPPAVIVSDVRMPEHDGFALIEKLRDRRQTIPVILMSAYADERSQRRARELGAIGFLEKPVDTILLGRVLERATTPSESPA